MRHRGATSTERAGGQDIDCDLILRLRGPVHPAPNRPIPDAQPERYAGEPGSGCPGLATEQADPQWVERYQQRFPNELPRGKEGQRVLAETIGQDGAQLLQKWKSLIFST